MERGLLALMIGVVGVALIVVTFLGFYFAYEATAPTLADIDRCVAAGDPQCVQTVLTASQKAGSIRNTFYAIVAIEIIGTIAALIIALSQKTARKT